MNDELIEEQWICPWCGNDEMWFDRTLAFLPDGSEIGMQDRCTKCGKSVDELPEEEVSEEVVDVVVEPIEEPSDSDFRDEGY